MFWKTNICYPWYAHINMHIKGRMLVFQKCCVNEWTLALASFFLFFSLFYSFALNLNCINTISLNSSSKTFFFRPWDYPENFGIYSQLDRISKNWSFTFLNMHVSRNERDKILISQLSFSKFRHFSDKDAPKGEPWVMVRKLSKIVSFLKFFADVSYSNLRIIIRKFSFRSFRNCYWLLCYDLEFQRY